MIKDLNTVKDVKEVREKLLKEQQGLDAITGLEIPTGKAVLDHCHKTGFVRAVLHRQSNAVLGKIENLWTRYLSYWYTGSLSTFLRQCADYIDKKHPEDYMHPAWKKKVLTEFNKLTASAKDKVLQALEQEKCSNNASRVKAMKELIKDKTYSSSKLFQTIKENS